MENKHKTALSRCNRFIKKNITNFGDVMDKLLQDDCLTWDERSRIGQEKPIDEQCQILLEILIKRGGKCYNSFLEALIESGNNHVMHEVQKAEQKTKEVDSDKKYHLSEDLLEEKDSEIDKLKNRVGELEGDLKKERDDLFKLKYQQIRTLDDLKRSKEKLNIASQRDGDIRPLEKKNRDLEKEIERLKEKVDYLEKEISLKEDVLKRAEEEKCKLENDNLKAIQSLERKNEEMEKKQIQTLRACERMAENMGTLTVAVANLENEIKVNQTSSIKQYDFSRQPIKQGVTTRLRAVPHKMSTIPKASNWSQRKVYQKPTE